MSLLQTAQTFYALLAALSTRAANDARRVWSELDPEQLSASWTSAQAAERLYVAVSTGQLTAAVQAAGYVAAALGEQSKDSDPMGLLRPQSFAGVASDGRDLESLLLQPLIQTLASIADGTDLTQAMESGEAALMTIASTQVSDAGRAATDVAMVTEPEVRGYVRMLNPPACGRCAILAGKFFRFNTGFLRHPNCDCVHIPADEDIAGDVRTDPQQYFESLTGAEQNRYFTKAGADAIRAGADMNQVVNARRGAAGLSQPGRLTEREQTVLRGGRSRGRLGRVDVYGRQLEVTTEGSTIRGLAGKRLIASGGAERKPGQRLRSARTPRLMPEAIASLANGDRDEQVRLLKRFGYIV